jgi:mono/diheme cytochrome c family protein
MRRTNTTNFFLILLAAAGVGLLWTPTASAQNTPAQATPSQNTPAQANKPSNTTSHIGKLTGYAENADMQYRRYCVGCHGELGNGEGENAQWIDPKPRNFTLGIFKCRSTPTGTLPTDKDLYDTIGRGIVASNMPQWIPLTDQERANLVAKVKSFSPRFATEEPGTPIQIPPEPQVTAAELQKGKAVYDRVQCWKCHGRTGRGDGPSASTLTDDLGVPIKPYNFHDETRFKCGSSDEDLYRIFMTGLDGTPMPSWSDNIKPDEAWALVLYLRTLQPIHSKEKEIAKQIGLNSTTSTTTPAATPQK